MLEKICNFFFLEVCVIIHNIIYPIHNKLSLIIGTCEQDQVIPTLGHVIQIV